MAKEAKENRAPLRVLLSAVGWFMLNFALNATVNKYGSNWPDTLIILLWIAPIVPFLIWGFLHERMLFSRVWLRKTFEAHPVIVLLVCVLFMGVITNTGYNAISKLSSYSVSSPVVIIPPTYNQARIVVLRPAEGWKSGTHHIWPGTDMVTGNTIAFFKTIYMLEVKNTQKDKTIRGLHLQLLSSPLADYNGKFINLPIYSQKNTTVDLDPGASAFFEIAYHYTLTSERPPSEQLPISLPNTEFYGIYNFLRGSINKDEMFDICYGRIVMHQNQLSDLSRLTPAKILLSATDMTPQNIALRVLPDSHRGFKLEIDIESLIITQIKGWPYWLYGIFGAVCCVGLFCLLLFGYIKSKQMSRPPQSAGVKQRQSLDDVFCPFTVTWGSNQNRFVTPASEDRPSCIINWQGFDLLRGYFKNCKLYVNTDEIRDNEIAVTPTLWDKNFNDTALEIVDENLMPRLQLIYRNPGNVMINGIFNVPGGVLAVEEMSIEYYPPHKLPPKLRRIFKYPSRKYKGQELSEHDLISYYDFLILYDVTDPENWFPFFEVKQDGVWQKIPSEEEPNLLTLKHRKDLFDYPNPVLRFPCTRQEFEEFSREFIPEDMIHSMREKLKDYSC
jgi:hypothetical protein